MDTDRMRDDGMKSRLWGSKEVGRWKKLLYTTKVYMTDLLFIENLMSIEYKVVFMCRAVRSGGEHEAARGLEWIALLRLSRRNPGSHRWISTSNVFKNRANYSYTAIRRAFQANGYTHHKLERIASRRFAIEQRLTGPKWIRTCCANTIQSFTLVHPYYTRISPILYSYRNLILNSHFSTRYDHPSDALTRSCRRQRQ